MAISLPKLRERFTKFTLLSVCLSWRDDVERLVAAAVIYKQDFPLIGIVAFDKLYQTLIESGEHSLFVVDRNQ